MSSGMVPVIDRDLEVEHLGPLGALGAAEAPGVALVLDVAEHQAGLGREARLHEHLVAAHLDDGVDVLDVDRALLHARPAGETRPQHVGVDGRRARGWGPRPWRRRPPSAASPGVPSSEPAAASRRAGAADSKRLSRSPMMRSLGDRGLPVFQAGHTVWQRPHSVQRQGVEELLPAQVLDVAGTEDGVLGDVLHVHVGRVVERAQGPGPARGGHVDGGQGDVEVLRVGQEDQRSP